MKKIFPLGLMLLTVFVSTLRFAPMVESVGLDSSWTNAYNFFFQEHARFGHDTIFTWGPLGWLEINAYSEQLYWPRLIYHIVFALYSCFVVQQVSKISDNYCAGLIATSLLFFGRSEDIIAFMQLVSIFLIIYNNNSSRFIYYLSIILPAFFITFAGFVKFTLWTMGLILIFLAFATKLFQRNIRQAFLIISVYAIGSIILWLAGNQQFADFMPYIYYSLEISRGYNEAMAIVGKTKYLLYSIVLLILLGFMFLAYLRIPQKSIGGKVFWVSTIIITLIVWKHGFVRHDGHQNIFFAFIGLLPGLLLAANRQIQARNAWSCWIFNKKIFPIIILLSFFGIGAHDIKIGLNSLVYPFSASINKNALTNELLADQVKSTLPQIKQVVGNQTVDIYNYQQSYVLKNQLKWKNRPVFQGYSAYTPILMRKNQESLISDFPDYILFNNQTIDNRMPLMDDSLWVQEILHNYSPILTESNFILFQRNSNYGKSLAPAMINQQKFAIGETINITRSSGFLLSSIDIQYSFLGKLRALAYKPPEIYVNLIMKNNEVRYYRIIPEMVRAPFILSPLSESNEDLLRALANNSDNEVVALKLICEDNTDIYFNSTVNINFYTDAM